MISWLLDRFAARSARATTQREAYYLRRARIAQAKTNLRVARKVGRFKR